VLQTVNGSSRYLHRQVVPLATLTGELVTTLMREADAWIRTVVAKRFVAFAA
jgi:hypothetical protein